jgi:archaea-specific DNA-binding protein
VNDYDNSIFVGDKPFMNYVTGIVMQFTTKEAQTVIVKARGKFITRAVDVALVAATRFLAGKIAVSSVRIDAEEIRNKDGDLVRVSIIEITLARVG